MKVFLHGFMGNPEVWNPFLSEGDFAPALLGHDPSAPEENVASFEDEVARLVAMIQAKERPIHLIGYSLGARLALGIANRMMVDRLTLISGRDGLEDAGERAQRIQDDERWATRFEACRDVEAFAQALALWDAQPVFKTRTNTAAIEGRFAHDPKRLAASMRALGLGRMPVYGAEIQCENVEIICGYDDEKFRALGQPLATKLRARFVAIEGAGHDLPREAQAALKRLLLQGDTQ